MDFIIFLVDEAVVAHVKELRQDIQSPGRNSKTRILNTEQE
jgi:hypothetical protein